MKKLIAITIVTVSALFFTSCQNSTESETSTSDSLSSTTEAAAPVSPSSQTYINLETGATVRRDDETGLYVDESGSPVEFYVDVNTMDTFYGQTNQNVNNAIIHEGNDWRVDESKIKIDENEAKIKNPDGSKAKVEDDEVKTKDGNTKTKAENDEAKIKQN